MRHALLFVLVVSFVKVGFCDIQSGLLGNWTLDEASGLIAYDSSGNANNMLVAADSVITRVPGVRGGAFRFDSASAGPVRIDSGSVAFQSQQFSGGLWMKLAVGGGGDLISVNDVWMIRAEALGFLDLIILDKPLWVGDTSINNSLYRHLQTPILPSLFDNMWHHVVCTSDSNGSALYFDGKLVASADMLVKHVSYPKSPMGWSYTTFRLSIGGHPYQSGFGIKNGTIDEVRIYNRVLSAADVSELYRATYSPRRPMLLLPDSTSNLRETISWSRVAGATYTITIDTSLKRTAPLVSQTVSDTFFTPTFDLPRQNVYVWLSPVADTDLVTMGMLKIRYLVSKFAIPFIPAQTHETMPTFRWHPVAGATSYKVMYGYSTIDSQATLTDTQFTPGTALIYSAYRWMILAETPTGPVSSGVLSFIVVAPSRPVLYPVLPNPTKTLRPTFTWGPVANATSYTIQISLSVLYQVILDSATVPGLSYTASVDLPYDSIFWHVTANTGSAYPAYSSTENFVVSATGLDQEILSARPSNPARAAGAISVAVRRQRDGSAILVGGMPRGARAEVFAVSGQCIASQNERDGAAVLNVSRVARGIVFVKIRGSGSAARLVPVVQR